MAEARGRHVEGRLAENILYFARALRAAGIPVGLGRGARCAGGRERRACRRPRGFLLDAARGIREAARAFDSVRSGVPHFLPQARLYRKADRLDAAGDGRQRRRSRRRRARNACRRRCSAALNERDDKSEVEIDARLTVSDREVLQKKDFAQMTAAEIAAAKQAIARLALPLDMLRTRRWRQAGAAT